MSGQLLVLVLDVNPNQKVFADDPKRLTAWLDAVLCFSNAHLSVNPCNGIAALGATSSSSHFLYPEAEEDLSDVSQRDGQYELFYSMESTIRRRVSDILKNESGSATESLLAGSLCMALTYVNRRKKENPEIGSRILVLTASGDAASQYMNYMNVFFTAQKHDILLDACTLSKDSPLLQQGADITGGIYINVTDVSSLLQFLLWIFIPQGEIRCQLGLPSAHRVDFRAACFCHRQLVDVGFVCSVCLSIFCKFSPICTTCQAVFRTPGPLLGKKKKSLPPFPPSLIKK